VRFARIVLAASMLLSPVVAAAPPAIPPGAASCSGCHASGAAVATDVPRLASRTSAEIVAALREFRLGKRPATVMDRIAKGFSDDEAAAIAAWLAAQRN
jgi:cytochrome subunit of sulfide dehydrogenase